MNNLEDRHFSTRTIAKWFNYEHLAEPGRSVSRKCSELAEFMLDALEMDSPELTAGLRKLLEAKDCFVRAAIEEQFS